jgi:small subunit ribosomal protein S1
MTDFGAFVELAPGVDALLHVSQISKDHVEKPADALTVGQEVEAKIVEINQDTKQIGLSMRALMSVPEEEAAPVEEEITSYTEESSFTLGDILDSEEAE